MHLLFLIIVFSACNQMQQQQPKQELVTGSKKKPEYYTYGLQEPYYKQAEEHVFAKYEVVVKRVAGCEVTDSLLKAVKTHNDSLFFILGKKYNGLTEDAVIQEMQDYVSTTKAIEATIQRALRRKLATLNPLQYTYINWEEDTTKGQYCVDFYANRYESKQADTLLWQLKVNPSTDYILIKTKEGVWNECIK